MADILLTCGYILLALYLIGKLPFFEVPGLRRTGIGLIFLLKVAAATTLWWVYTHHYTDRSTADIFKFFDDGNVMFSALPDQPLDYLGMLTGIGNDQPHFDEHYYSVMNNWYRKYDTGYYNDAHTMIRFSALVRIFSFGVFHVHSVFAAFLSLLGLTALYKAFRGFVPGAPNLLAAAVFLWPSMLFWTSAPLKEALLMLGLGLFLWQLLRRMEGALPWTGWGLMAIGLLIQLGLKSYVLACMVPGLAALWWCRFRPGREVLKFGAVHLCALAVLLALPQIGSGLDVAAIIQQKQRDMLGLISTVPTGSYIPMDLVAADTWELARQIPQALFNTYCLPLLTWRMGIFGLMGALENLLLLALIPAAFWLARPWSQVNKAVLLYSLTFCLVLGLLIGWTTPVVGVVLRYRVPLLPFFTLAVLLVIDPIKMRRRLPFIRP